MLRALWHEREQQKQRIDDLYLENLQLQKESLRYKKASYGPRADRLSKNELAQALLEFAEEREQKPLPGESLLQGEAEPEVRRVQRRKGRRALANFENLPVSTHVYELTAEQRRCSCCGEQRQEIGSEESWQIEYLPGHFERLQHVRKKYACAKCELAGENPQIATAAKAETASEKGLAGPGLLAFIVTSKFPVYLPLYRLEDIFERQGFEISRATQSVWCGDVADLVMPLYKLMAERVRQSHVVATDDTILPMLSVGKAQSARMWVYVGDEANPYNVFDFTLHRGRDGPKEFLKDYTEVLLADAYGGYNGVVAGNAITRAGCWSHARRKFVEAEKTALEVAREAVDLIGRAFAVEKQAKDMSVAERLALRQTQSVPVLAELRQKLLAWKEQLLPKHPMAQAVNYSLGQWHYVCCTKRCQDRPKHPISMCPPSESLRHRKGNRDQIAFLKLYLLYRRSTRGFSFSIYADLSCLFRQKSSQRKSSGFQRIQIPLLPRPPAALQQFLERPWLLKVGSLLSRHIELIG